MFPPTISTPKRSGFLAEAGVEPVDELGLEAPGQAEGDEGESRLPRGRGDVAQVYRQSLAAEVAGTDRLL